MTKVDDLFFFFFFFGAVLSRSHVDFFLFNCLNFLTNACNVPY